METQSPPLDEAADRTITAFQYVAQVLDRLRSCVAYHHEQALIVPALERIAVEVALAKGRMLG